MTIIISGHVLLDKDGNDVYGTGSSLGVYLKKYNKPFIFIKHPIYGGFSTIVEYFINNSGRVCRGILPNSTSLLLKSFQEMFSTLRVVARNKNETTIYIGIDPLNALFGIISKKIFGIKKVIFYTADYAKVRFGNRLLNSIYHLIDRFAVKNADEVWNVSTRIYELRLQQNIIPERNFFVPNSPAFYDIKRRSIGKINRYELITVATSTKNTDLTIIFTAISDLSKKYPDISLKIIGLDNWQNNYINLLKKLNLSSRIKFLKCMPHAELIDNLCAAGVGLALYTNAFSWTYFSDSMKARDYLACGLPVIMTDISSTAGDIRKRNAGMIISFNRKNLVYALDELLSNINTYKRYRNNAIKLARDFDIEKILQKRLRE